MADRDINDLDILCIIPARAGSKGLPGKNLKALGQMPLIAWTILWAKAVRYKMDVVFTTEDEEIAKIAESYGAQVPFIRPKELAEDNTSSLAVLLHALTETEKIKNKRYDFVMFLQPTSPFRHTGIIEKAIESLFCEAGVLSAVGLQSVKDAHPYWTLNMDERNIVEYYLDIDPRPMRRQDLPQAYHLNGAISVSRREYFDRAQDPMPAFSYPFVGVPMEHWESVNIDTLEDWWWAEFVLAKNSRLKEEIEQRLSLENRPHVN